MLDPTEGVPHSRVGKPFLRRNLAKDVDANAILSEDRQDLRIDVSSYRIIFTYNGIPGRPFVYEKKTSKNEMAVAEVALKKAKAKRDGKMKEKFVTNAAWMKDQSGDEVERRKAAWQKGLEEGLWRMEENLKAAPTGAATSGDAMVFDTAI
jgi:hypothetical protein